jgi:type IV secretion system protein VirB5
MFTKSKANDITHSDDAPQSSTGVRYEGYVAAQRAWDVRYGDIIKRARSWRLFAFGLLGCDLLLIFGMINLASKSHIVPYVVAVDSIGKAQAISPAEASSPVDERVKRAILLSWIQDVRSVSTDAQAEYNTVTTRVYTHLAAGSEAQAYVGDFYRSDSPFDRGQDGTVQVDIHSIVQDSPTTYRVNWAESSRDKSGVVTGKQEWQGAFTIAINAPTDEKLVRVNPLGVYLTNVSWTKVFGGANQ